MTQANHTFLDLVQVGVESAVTGQNIRRWLSRPGAGIAVILDLVERHGSVRAMRTTLEGELGASTEVEISATGGPVGVPDFVGLVLHDVTMREPTFEGKSVGPAPADKFADAPLGTVVRSSVEAIERRRIVDALAETGGNRTLAARTLKLSRQSLYAKLKKYRLGNK